MDVSPTPLPHARYPHVFVIMRVDRYLRSDRVEDSVKVKKVVTDQGHAEREVERLNTLNRDKDSEYYWEIAQLETAQYREGEPS